MNVDSSSLNKYTPDEMMTIAAARLIWPGCVCFVGIGVPSAAANLARLTHAPDIVPHLRIWRHRHAAEGIAVIDWRWRVGRNGRRRGALTGNFFLLAAGWSHRCRVSWRGADRSLWESQYHCHWRLRKAKDEDAGCWWCAGNCPPRQTNFCRAETITAQLCRAVGFLHERRLFKWKWRASAAWYPRCGTARSDH